MGSAAKKEMVQSFFYFWVSFHIPSGKKQKQINISMESKPVWDKNQPLYIAQLYHTTLNFPHSHVLVLHIYI